MNTGFWICGVLVVPLVILGIIFAMLKEKATKFVSGFNAFSKEEQALYAKSRLAWGCDICQLACPVNQGVQKTPIDAFQNASLALTKEEILRLSEEEFQAKYKDYAFAYKGIQILRRNVSIQDEYKMESIKKENT